MNDVKLKHTRKRGRENEREMKIMTTMMKEEEGSLLLPVPRSPLAPDSRETDRRQPTCYAADDDDDDDKGD